jgi:hypothetical protein
MKTISIETAIEEIKQDILAAGPRHGCDPDIIARVYSVLCADCEEPVCVVAGDKTASQVYVEGKPAAPAEFASVAWRIEDIKERMPEWSDKKCQKFLEKNADAIQCAMIDAGGEEIADLLPRE